MGILFNAYEDFDSAGWYSTIYRKDVLTKLSLILVTLFILSCKHGKKGNEESLSKIEDSNKIKYVDFNAMEGIKVRYFVDFDSIQVSYPNNH